MEFLLNVQMDNEAFAENPALELSRILMKLALRSEHWTYRKPGDEGNVMDANGNKVGTWEINA